MAKLKCESADLTQANIAKLKELFPSVVTEARDASGKLKSAVNFEALRQLLGDEAVEGEEAYEFTWVGKKAAALEAGRPIRKTLRPCKEESKDWETTENLYIEGDNLEVLKLLQESYLDKVKMIYIDPPYNTGNDFIYRDDFKMGKEEYELATGSLIENDAGERQRMFRNTDSNGRFHSDWCSMIYPRLLLARNLLRDDGVIFISCDENELASLKLMCNEIFSEHNFIAELVWSAGRKNDSKYISISHEYILCYFKNIDNIKKENILWRERKNGLDDIYKVYENAKIKYGKNISFIEKELKSWYKNLPDGHPAKAHSHYNSVDENGIFFADNISWPGGGGPKYDVLHPLTKKPVKIPSRGWLVQKDKMAQFIKEGKVNFGTDETSVPTLKSYLVDREYSVPYSVFYKDGRASSKRLAELFGEKIFENPKDEEILQRIIEFIGYNDGDTFVDFFSGSGALAHALFNANLSTGKKGNFILVQLPEEINPNAHTSEKSKKVAKSAIRFLDELGAPHNICEIGKERIRRAGAKIKKENAGKPGIENLDIGFRVLKCDSTNMKDVYFTPSELNQASLKEYVSNIKPDRTDMDLLFGCLTEWGLPLSLRHETVAMDGFKVHFYDENALACCFDADISEAAIIEMAKRKPLRAVFRDASFRSSQDRINAGELFKNYSPDTEVRVL